MRLALISNDGELFAAEQEIPILLAGDITSLVYSDLPVTPGTIYEIEVMTLFDDDEEENDSIAFLFMVNPDG